MANNSIDLISLDPDTAKASLVAFLQSQNNLKSYAYDGAVINEILSVLGTNQFKLGFYYNMLNSESWLDSAQLRSSVVSHAKDLNYTPASAKSSSATVNISIPTDGTISVITIPKGTSFSTRVGSNSFNFTVDQTYIYTSANGTFNTGNVVIHEGSYVTDTYIMDSTNPAQSFVLSNLNADTDSLSVSVVEDSGASLYEYSYSSSLLGVTPKSLVYFLQCNETENYEVLFGNNLYGRQPVDGAVINITYRVASGDIADGAQQFSLNRDVTNGHLSGSVMVNTVLASTGGTGVEDIESIRFMAPRYYSAQERAIGVNDYETLLQANFPEIKNVAVFGGETLVPPQYGTVLVSVNLNGINGLPSSKQAAYAAFLGPRSAATPIFVSPQTLYYSITSSIDYNINQTTISPTDMSTIVTSAITSYNSVNLDDFKVTLRASRIGTLIDSAHTSIVGNDTDINVYVKLNPILGLAQNIVADLVVPIYSNYPPVPSHHSVNESKAIWSNQFVYKGSLVTLEDDSLGNIRIVQAIGSYNIALQTVGTVDYSTGVVKLNNIVIDALNGPSLKIYGKPAVKDIAVVGNNILTCEVDEINLTINQVSE